MFFHFIIKPESIQLVLDTDCLEVYFILKWSFTNLNHVDNHKNNMITSFISSSSVRNSLATDAGKLARSVLSWQKIKREIYHNFQVFFKLFEVETLLTVLRFLVTFLKIQADCGIFPTFIISLRVFLKRCVILTTFKTCPSFTMFAITVFVQATFKVYWVKVQYLNEWNDPLGNDMHTFYWSFVHF